ncbi:MAG: hypothetical protein U0835_22155 [Isosphaeraceae bacterium]
MSTERARRALLFGALAYRLGLLDRRRLALGLTAWADAKDADGSSAFVQSGALDARAALQVEASSSQLLALHDGDVAQALGTVHVDADTRDALAAIPDAELRAALGGLDTSAEEEVDLGATLGLDCPDDGPERTITGEFEKTERFDPPSGETSRSSGSVTARPVLTEPSGEHTIQDLGHNAAVSGTGRSTVSAILSTGSHDRTERFDDPEATMADGPGNPAVRPRERIGPDRPPPRHGRGEQARPGCRPERHDRGLRVRRPRPPRHRRSRTARPTHDHTAEYDPSRPGSAGGPVAAGGGHRSRYGVSATRR